MADTRTLCKYRQLVRNPSDIQYTKVVASIVEVARGFKHAYESNEVLPLGYIQPSL